ncbi:uncharacterized protein CTRU02_210278 [Colletotrichum truncatum]|uniref:Uncharacterized protein n=1 Tax=Colletotrichum truncatum TaxID=5467 RepID=A0ACC3YXU0_COLTU|nr:uncharacterized protein CTRU02_11490 [Colletotrichum truncatum]KAF6785865.1 hypothetical protein CTRU02_11490 [Colletotrichum truncatum]
MSTNISTSITTTAAALLAITTPFVQPPACDSWRTTTVRARPLTLVNGTTLSIPVVVSEPASSCYPSGWKQFPRESRLHFNPGVCPEGWTYFDMAEAALYSTAFCCNSGFSYTYFNDYSPFGSLVSLGCVKGGPKTSSNSATPDTSSTDTVHEAWVVTWKRTDTPTLTPKLPTLTNYMTVPTWTPGEKIPDGKYDATKSGSGNQYPSQSLIFFITIGIPLISATLIGSCVWCCVRECKKQRRQKRLDKVTGGGLSPSIYR